MELVNQQDIQVFNCELGSVRVVVEDNEPLFLANDVAQALGYEKKSKMYERLDDDDKVLKSAEMYESSILEFPQNVTKIMFVTESGLYNSILGSNKPQAKKFKKWITNEVLPSIKKNGVIAGKDKYLPQCRENCLQTFAYNGGNLDYGLLNNEPMFNLNYIGSLLEITNPRMSIDINDKDYVIKIDNSVVSFTYNRKLNNRGELFLTEAGLYRLLLRSNNQKAEPFSKWVTKEVLPSLRKNGGYIANQENMTPEQIVANALIVAQNIIADRDKTIAEQKEVIEYQGGKLENFTSVERTRRSRQELSTKLNKTIRLLAEQKFNKDYGKAYTYIYGEFAKLHCIPDKVNMDYLKKNIDYLAECLAIATTELD